MAYCRNDKLESPTSQMDAAQDPKIPSMRPQPIMGLHFTLSSLSTIVYVFLYLTVVLWLSGPASTPYHALVWLFFIAALGLVVFSSRRSIEMIAQKIGIGWLYLMGNCIYAVVIISLGALHLSI